MSPRWKNAAYSLVLLSAILVVWTYRQSKSEKPIKIEGETMGTTYHITYFDSRGRNLKPSVDSLLLVFNQSLNTYFPNSEITQFNEGKSRKFELPFFLPVLRSSREITEQSEGAFDPTVMPLVNAWGFGPGKKIKPDSVQVDSIRDFIGFDKIRFNEDSLWKEDDRVQLDFSAIAKGYGVDEVARLIRSKGIENLFVEIGGEISATGKNLQTKKSWEAGVLDPSSTYANQSFKAYVSLSDKAMATSGNYFNYYEEDGKKFSHTIDPSTGYPIQREILSASVFAKDCMTADGWATAFMVMGHEKAIDILSKHPELDAFLIYSDANGITTYVTKGIESQMKINP